jgi:spore germination cell wall hydrolase CwlJ-like protein
MISCTIVAFRFIKPSRLLKLQSNPLMKLGLLRLLGRDDYKFKQEQADRHLLSAVTAQADANLGALTDTIQNVIKAGGDNDNTYQQILGTQDEVQALTERFRNHSIQQLEAHGASKEVIDAFNAKVDRYQKGFQDLYFGPTSRFAQRNRTYQSMQTDLGISAEKALPFYMFAKRVLGDATTEAVFGGVATNALSPELQGKIKAEVMGWDPTHTNEGMQILTEIGALSQGNKSLSDIPEERITGDYVKSLRATTQRAAEMIMDPEPDNPTEYKSFLGSLGNLSIAALRIQPGNKDIDALNYAIDAVTDHKNLGVMTNMLKDKTWFGPANATFLSTRQAAAQVLEVTRSIPDLKDQHVVLNGSGKFVVQIDKKNSIEDLPPIMDEFGLNQITAPLWSVNKLNPAMQKKADVLNKAVYYLTDTAAADPQMQGYSRQELFMHYAKGTQLTPKNEGGQAPIDVQKQVNALEVQLHKMSDQIEKDIPFEKLPPSFKSPTDAIVRTVIGEAGAESDVGKKAVAAVILNRARLASMSPEAVVTAPGQFEAWSTRSNELMGIDENSIQYKKVEALVKAAMAGEDPTNGADHFYAPKLQSDLGRAKPSWDDGTGLTIGNHIFIKKGYKG